MEPGDLFVLVADRDIEQTIEGLLSRPRDLQIKQLKFKVGRHPNRDGGCRTQAVDYLRPFLNSYHHALVVFDLDGCGSDQSREEVQQEVEFQLDRNGWEERSKVIVIDPEIEAWVWSGSPRVPETLGWAAGSRRLRKWLDEQGLWPKNCPKPPDPKRAMREAMAKPQPARRRRMRRSPVNFRSLAETVNLDDCRDPAFNELKETLQDWFPEAPQ